MQGEVTCHFPQAIKLAAHLPGITVRTVKRVALCYFYGGATEITGNRKGLTYWIALLLHNIGS